nr:hypothetical protein [Halogeometricum sp. CBA1124]
MQATAEDAGQESVNKVTNRVEVLSTHGVVGTEQDIDNITMTVRLAAGSSSVDMNETSIKYLSAGNVTTLTNTTNLDGNGDPISSENTFRAEQGSPTTTGSFRRAQQHERPLRGGGQHVRHRG